MGNDCLQSARVVLQYLQSVLETNFENLEASMDIREENKNPRDFPLVYLTTWKTCVLL